MEQHALPQDITTYKFRLVGSMTLKQFLELAGGVVLAWLIFNSGLNFLIKWSLAPLFAFLDFALAFIPIEDRPLDLWIINFFKAIYQPTQFVYKNLPKQLNFMAPVRPRTRPTSDASTVQPEQLEDYLKTLPSSPITAFDAAEQKYLDYIQSLFGALGNKIKTRLEKNTTQPSSPVRLVRGIRVRKLMHPQMCLLPHATLYQAPTEPVAAAMPTPVRPAVIKAQVTTQSKLTTKPTPKTVTKPQPVKKTVNARVRPKPVVKLKAQPTTETVFAKKDMVLPQTPDKPNLITGITLDEKGKILPSVILEIKDNQGLPVRALKSNKLGQFFIATPLEDGVYQVAAESDNKRFAIMKLEAKNEVIPPLKIQAL